MSINKLISVKEAILEASEDMGFDLTRDKPIFSMWAVRAEKDIGSYFSYKRKRVVLDIKGCVAKLPCNAAYIKTVVLGDLGCECGELINSLIGWASSINVSNTETFLIIDKPDSNQNMFNLCGAKWEVQGNNIIFSSNLDGQKVTIEYLGLEEDCDGFVMINENHVPAIISYIMWKFCVRSRFSPNKMELGDTVMHQKEYNRLVSDARAIDCQLTDSERQQCVALLHDSHSGFGLEVGM